MSIAGTLNFSSAVGSPTAVAVTDGMGGSSDIAGITYRVSAPGVQLFYTPDQSGHEGLLVSNSNNSSILIDTAEGSAFAFKGVFLGDFAGQAQVRIEGFRDGSSTGSVTLSLTSGGSATFSTTQLTPSIFNHVDEVRLTNPAQATWSLVVDNLVFDDPISPVVAGVGSSTANGTYKVGDALTVNVVFSETVIVTGAPTLALNSGGTAVYTSGSGSDVLSFSYVIAAGEASADLDYTGAGALDLDGGSIAAASNGAPAVVTLPSPGAAGSLGANKALVIDGVAPSIVGQTPPANGASKAGDVLTFQITYDEAVMVSTGGGIPYLALNFSSGVVAADYVGSSNGGRTLSFAYTIVDGDSDPGGFTVGSSIALNGRSIRDAAGNDAATSGLSFATSGVIVDTQKPTSTALSVGFSADSGEHDEDLITNVAGQTVSGTLSAAPGAGEQVLVSLDNGGNWTTASASGSSWSLSGVTLSGSGTLQVVVEDAAGNRGTPLSASYVLDTTQPTTSVSTASFSDDTGASQADFITREAIQTISGTLSAVLAGDERVQVSLNDGASWSYANAAGNAWSLTGQTLTSSSTLKVRVIDAAGNSGPTLSQAYVFDTTAPSLSGVSLNFSSDTGTAGDRITRTVLQSLSGSGLAMGVGDKFELSLDGDNWTEITPTGSNWSLATPALLSGGGSITLRITDAAGNVGSRDYAYTIDTTAPSLVMSTSAASVTSDQTATITFQFSEAPLDFTLADVTVSNGSLSNLAGSGQTWTALFTPRPGLGTANLNVAAAGYKDLAGNDGTASNALQLTVTAPVTTQPEPEPEPQPEFTPPEIREIFAAAAGFAPNSSKALSSNVTLPDGTVVPNPAFETAVRLAALISRFQAGLIDRGDLIDGVVELSAPTSGVALSAYQFFTGSTPTKAGMAWLIDSANNANDLTDPYYARFNEVNRFINFAVALGTQGEGKAAFEAKFAALDFQASVRLAYDMIIGLDIARAAGVDVDAALAWIASQEGYFDAFAGSDLGGKAAMIGYIMQAGFEAKVGRYYDAAFGFIEDSFDGSPAYQVDLVGGQHLGG
ncbi:Ig-like domain-containing protein [Caulobacter segnis]|uniref:Ig-like domain-containing protein n=1 Tax=Caulobacter segnis TaxID=88688 RepID=UPI00241027CE|nr:Ig-like domain-containing protein [Caulobacter segnis]MDG2520437.1 Ig-like domain-containing protein [Caulobacter segnis]